MLTSLIVYLMPYKTGAWGVQAKERDKMRREYFKEYFKTHGRQPPKVFRPGYYGELLAMDKLPGSKHVGASTHDLEWSGKKIEVKTAKRLLEKTRRYCFNIKTQKGKTDYFVFIILGSNNELVSIHLIPDREIVSRTNFYLYPNGHKYDKYRIKLG